MSKTNKAVAQQISVSIPDNTRFSDLETKFDLRDRKHILAVKNSREEYRRGKIVNTKEFILSLK